MFTNSQLPIILALANEMWEDARKNRDAEIDVESVRAVAENQRVSFDPVLVSGKCRGYKATWLKRCGKEAIAFDDAQNGISGDECTLNGDPIQDDKKEYAATHGYFDQFSVTDDDCNGKFAYEEKVAKGLQDCFKNILTRANASVVAFLAANLQNNAYATGVGDVVGDLTYIDSEHWTPDLMGYFKLVQRLNKISNRVMLSGTNFFESYFNAGFENLNSNERDRIAKYNHFQKWYWDVENLDTVLGAPSTLMFDAGAVGMFTKNWYEMTPKQIAPNKTIYSMALNDMFFRNGGSDSPFMFDIEVQEDCLQKGVEQAGRMVKKETWRVKMQYGLIYSPEDCGGNSGILQFVKGEAPEGE